MPVLLENEDEVFSQVIPNYGDIIEPNKMAIEIINGREQGQAKSRNQNYYERIISTYTDLQFKEYFRMKRTTFEVHKYKFFVSIIIHTYILF